MEKEYNIDEIVSNIDFEANRYKKLSNGLMLTNREISVLKQFNIDYLSCSSLKEVLYKVEEVCSELDGEELEELDYISSTIAERNYYQNTNK